jgi:hypothetical protein
LSRQRFGAGGVSPLSGPQGAYAPRSEARRDCTNRYSAFAGAFSWVS